MWFLLNLFMWNIAMLTKIKAVWIKLRMRCLFFILLPSLAILNSQHVLSATQTNADLDTAALNNISPSELTLEQLANIEVTSMMKTASRLSETPGAIFVLSNDDIKRLGATSIPEALRVVPGLHVAKIDANKWAVSARGFNGQFANKLLVLVDGRSVYTPLYSGVWWDQLDVLMEDIDRIEVIRGPNASLWGANAMNGVINIITKKAQNSQGGLASGYAGTDYNGLGIRYGTKISDDTFVKVYGRTATHNNQQQIGLNQDANDQGSLNKLGFRLEKSVTSQDTLTLQGDVFNGISAGSYNTFPKLTASLQPVLAPPYTELLDTTQSFSGFNLLGRWEQSQSGNSNTALQIYWDNHKRVAKSFNTSIEIDSVDIDFQHNIKLSNQQNLLWGAGYRLNKLNAINSTLLLSTKPNRTDDLYSLFIQDEISLVPNSWKLILGSRLEHNPSTGFELEPNARLTWIANTHHTIWASVSRAVRTPDWARQDGIISAQTKPPVGGGAATPFNPVIIAGTVGNPNIVSEKLNAYELGWHGMLNPNLSTDVALFYYDYFDISSTQLNAPDLSNIAAGYVVQTATFNNAASATTRGAEIALDWQIQDSWKLRMSYSYFDSHLTVTNNSGLNSINYPAQQAMLWSQNQISPNINLDLNLRYVASFSNVPQIEAYTALNARLAWRAQANLELSLIGKNLLSSGQQEYNNEFLSPATKSPSELLINAKLDF